MATIADIIQLVRDHLNFHKSLDEGIIMRALEWARREVETAGGRFPLPFFLEHPTEVVTTQANMHNPLPDRFLALMEGWPPVLLKDSVPVREVRRVGNWERVDRSRFGPPEMFDIVSTGIIWAPVPDGMYHIQFPCFLGSHSSDWFVGETDRNVPWSQHFPNFIAALASHKLLGDLRDVDGQQAMQEILRTATVNYSTAVEARKHTGRTYTYGP